MKYIQSSAVVILIMTVFLSCGDGLIDTYDSSIAYRLRDTGPAGGLIFYVNPDYKRDGWRYLEAAPFDQSPGSVVWSDYSSLVNASSAYIGSGRNNTALISAVKYITSAAGLCENFSYKGYDDWFLPSIDELEQMCWNLRGINSSGTFNPDVPDAAAGGIGGFSQINYWSSTESDTVTSWCYHFGTGTAGTKPKNPDSALVRAVRAF